MATGMTGYISKIQRYSTKDGPGIRSTVFFVGCNLKCAWCSNPELIEPGTKILYHKELCVKCGRCIKVATPNSIKMTEEGCSIDRKLCKNLDECAKVCYYDAYENLGQEITDEALFFSLMRDKEFYHQSGGGVTFSGGEAGLQSDFIIKVSKMLRKEGVHISLDTAGLLPENIMESLANNVDMVLLDIKAFDSKIHKRCTSVDNSVILKNTELLSKKNIDLCVRLIVVPCYNDDISDFKNRLVFLKQLGINKVDILKFHKLGSGKYTQLGMRNPTLDIPEPNDNLINKYISIATSMGVDVKLGG